MLDVLLAVSDSARMKRESLGLRRLYGGGIKVTWAKTCEAAIELLQTEEFDVCLMDYNLGDGTANDVLSGVDAFEIPTPIIVISPIDEEMFDLTVLRAGADDYLIDGQFDDRELERAIRHAIYRREKIEQLKKRAVHDHLTGLPNRYLLDDRLAKALQDSHRRGIKIGVLSINLDNMKQVNDRHGRRVGDRLIKRAADHIVATLRQTDTVCRIGGDEFLVVLIDVGDRDNAMYIAGKIVARVGEPVTVDDQRPVAGCSVGLSVFPDDSGDIDEVLQQARDALRRAKHQGGGRASW